MAKIVKLNVYEKTVYAVQVEDNLYIDEIGVKHLSPSPENCKNTRNVPPALRTAFEHLAKNHAARKKVEDKRAKFLKETKQQLNELEKDECAIMKELRDAKGVISRDEFVDAFYEALPDRVKDSMKQYGYSVGDTPYAFGYDDNHIYIIFQNHGLCTYCRKYLSYSAFCRNNILITDFTLDKLHTAVNLCLCVCHLSL